MKVLLDHSTPFLLAHGGLQTQIEKTKEALEAHGVEVEYLRWWDAGQKADLIHYFNAAPSSYLALARQIELPVVMTTLFSTTCNRPNWVLRCQGWMTQLILRLPGGEGVKNQLIWRTFNACEHNFVGTAAEQHVLQTVYRVPPQKISQVPLGLSEKYLRASPSLRNQPYLISTGTITPCKGSVRLAKLAQAARVPILFVGKPYHSGDPYWNEFSRLVDGNFVQHHPHVSREEDMIRLLQGARGFVLMSSYENWCLSAHEAVACGLPLLVPNLKWSRERFGNQAVYFTGNQGQDLQILESFYHQSTSTAAPVIKLWSWKEAAVPLLSAYEKVLKKHR